MIETAVGVFCMYYGLTISVTVSALQLNKHNCVSLRSGRCEFTLPLRSIVALFGTKLTYPPVPLQSACHSKMAGTVEMAGTAKMAGNLRKCAKLPGAFRSVANSFC